MRIAFASALLIILCPAILAQSRAARPNKPLDRTKPVALRVLVPPGDPLARQELRFDPTFAELTLQYLRTGGGKLLDQLAKSPAAAHILSHARNFDYDVPKTSIAALVADLVTPRSKYQDQIPACEQSLAFFTRPLLDDPHWVNDTLGYLPADFHFHGSLFLTFGYDIGVAFAPDASLNCGHAHFAANPRELKYYAIHELHHVGFMSYQPPPRIADMKTCGDLHRLVNYSTQLEGMAVWAAYERRRAEGALNDDDDYVALQDEARMRRDEEIYFQDLKRLQDCAFEPADDKAWLVIDHMSSGERLWYRVGARMAQKIEEKFGRPALVALVKSGPASFLETYQRAIASGK